jgi:hypothetical protein
MSNLCIFGRGAIRKGMNAATGYLILIARLYGQSMGLGHRRAYASSIRLTLTLTLVMCYAANLECPYQFSSSSCPTWPGHGWRCVVPRNP